MKQSLSVKPSVLSGSINIPPSKSHTLRAVLFAALARGTSSICNFLDSPDTRALLHACRLLGARISEHDNHLEITGVDGHIDKAEDVLQIGNSGIALRFLSAVAALGSHPIVITGDSSIRHQRPMGPLLNGLQQLGVKAISTNGNDFAPIIIQGPLRGGKAVINGADSQHVSALLIAGSLCKERIELFVENPGEKPWVLFTLKWLERLGIFIENRDYQHFAISGNRFNAFEFTVPGDFSTAAFPIAAALITRSEILVKNLDMDDFQGDKEILPILRKMGARLEYSNEGLHVKPAETLEGIEIDVNDVIDGLPILAVLGCYAKGRTILRNGKIARTKECDRISSAARELKKMGAKIEELEDGLIIQPTELQGAELDGCSDHRLSMALAVAGLGCKGKSIVSSAESIRKTHPGFVQDFQNLKAGITLL